MNFFHSGRTIIHMAGHSDLGTDQGHRPRLALGPGAMEVLFAYFDFLMKSCPFQHI